MMNIFLEPSCLRASEEKLASVQYTYFQLGRILPDLTRERAIDLISSIGENYFSLMEHTFAGGIRTQNFWKQEPSPRPSLYAEKYPLSNQLFTFIHQIPPDIRIWLVCSLGKPIQNPKSYQ